MRFVLSLILALFLFTGTVVAQEAPTPEIITEDDGRAAVVPPEAITDTTDAGDVVDSEVLDAGVDPDPIPQPEAEKPVLEDGAVPETPQEVGTVIGLLLDASKGGHWTIFVGLLLLLIVWGMNQFGLAERVGRKAVPWVTLGIAAVGAVGVGLAEGVAVLDALKLAAIEGGIAIMLWEALFKHFTAKKTDGSPRS